VTALTFNPYRSPTKELIRPPAKDRSGCRFSIKWLALACVGIATCCFGWVIFDALRAESAQEAIAILIYMYIVVAPAILTWIGLEITRSKGIPAFLIGIAVNASFIAIRFDRIDTWPLVWPVVLMTSLPLSAFLVGLLVAQDDAVSMWKRGAILGAAGLSLGLTTRIIAGF
jgi:hypothetical protein